MSYHDFEQMVYGAPPGSPRLRPRCVRLVLDPLVDLLNLLHHTARRIRGDICLDPDTELREIGAFYCLRHEELAGGDHQVCGGVVPPLPDPCDFRQLYWSGPKVDR